MIISVYAEIQEAEDAKESRESLNQPGLKSNALLQEGCLLEELGGRTGKRSRERGRATRRCGLSRGVRMPRSPKYRGRDGSFLDVILLVMQEDRPFRVLTRPSRYQLTRISGDEEIDEG